MDRVDVTPVEIAFPFRIDPSGKVAVESNPDQQVTNHIVSLVGTEPGERPMLTSYGVPTMVSVFEPDDELTAQQLLTDINNAAQSWERGVIVMDVTLDSTIQEPGVVNIGVLYSRTNSGANSPSDPTRTYTAVIKTNGDIR